MTHKNKKQRGVTLVEIAIVLVIIGLLLGGVLKGQELINNAKVRAMADRQNSLKVAWFSFIDRFQALPGDYVFAARSIPGAVNGKGDGQLTEVESPIVFQHLTAAGYIRCAQCTFNTDNKGQVPSASNSLVNTYGGVMGIFETNQYAYVGSGTATGILMSQTGSKIPSNIAAEVDRKIDDGLANGGDMVYSDWTSGTKVGTKNGQDKACMTTVPDKGTADGALASTDQMFYRSAQASPPVHQNCGMAVRI